ncbi:MAG: c-type cytochrome, partial [Balneolaceae bacterium]
AKPGGGFYAAKGAALDMGPRALTDAVIRGIRAGSQHSGVILEISEDGRSSEIIASGFRGPYLGIHPETGLLTASDQEGHSVPSTPLLSVKKGDYYGVPATAHRETVPETITPPLMWIPHSVDRSGTSQAWITSDQMGPLSGNLIHFSYGRPGLFRVLIDSTGSGAQGGISFIPGYYPVPTMKGAVHPSDGQLYMAGFTLWGTNSDGLAGLLRLRYTGLPDYMPGDFKVRDGGVILHFNEELDEESVREVSNYRVERWNYKRTEDYGSGYFRLDGSPGQELLPVYSAHLSDDGKNVFLAIPNIVNTEQMQVSYKLNASDGTAIKDDFWFTVNHLEPIDLIAEGFSGIDSVELLADLSAGSFENRAASPEPATVERGRELFQRTGCMGCHTTDGSEGTGVGPTMRGLFGSERQFRDGSTAIADEEYIRQALVNPGEQILEGYDEGMPSFLGILPDDEIDSIILFIKSL